MRLRYSILMLCLTMCQSIMACAVCQRQQPKITMGLTHGAGPQSNWDWVIIAIVAAFTLYVLFFSIKYLIKPGEKSTDHIKMAILNN
jgi:hypothetical protein